MHARILGKHSSHPLRSYADQSPCGLGSRSDAGSACVSLCEPFSRRCPVAQARDFPSQRRQYLNADSIILEDTPSNGPQRPVQITEVWSLSAAPAVLAVVANFISLESLRHRSLTLGPPHHW
jgi:hypothetical protein